MPQENVEVGRRLCEAFNRRDADEFVALLSADVEFEDASFWSEPPRIYRGRDEVREWFSAILEPWESFHMELEEITEASADRVFAGASLTGRGVGSGAKTELTVWYVIWVENGEITRRQSFRSRDDALDVAGRAE